jgi:hypothetical protein
MAFLEALEPAKGNIREAMRAAGYSDDTAISEVVNSLHEEIEALAKNIMSRNSVKAVVSVVDTIDNPMRPGTMNALAAAKELLDRVGMVKKTEDKGTTIKTDALFILPAKEMTVDIPKESE